MMEITLNLKKCTGCGDCVAICPVKAIEIVNEKAVIDTERCILCTSCVAECKEEAIRIPALKGEFVRAQKTD